MASQGDLRALDRICNRANAGDRVERPANNFGVRRVDREAGHHLFE